MRYFLLWIQLFFELCFADGGELIFSHVIFRHGQRAPSDPFVNVPFGTEAWTLGMGRMTYHGLYRQYELGRWLRKHYIEERGFLSKEYAYDEIYIRSSDHSRAIQSATSFAAGLYPHFPKDNTANEVLDLPEGLVPIPIYAVDAQLDKTNRPIPNCRRLRRLQTHSILSSIQGQILTSENANFLLKLSNLTGQQMTIENSFQVADYVEAARRINLTLPDWLENSYNQSKEVQIKFLRLLTGIDMQNVPLKTELQTAMGGNLLNELVDRMKLKIGCLEKWNVSLECVEIYDLKMFAYSSHDITITGLFGALDSDFLDYDQDELPEFSSLLLIELWKTEANEYVVKWKYRRPSISNGTLMELNFDYKTIEELDQKAQTVKAEPDPKTWCDE